MTPPKLRLLENISSLNNYNIHFKYIKSLRQCFQTEIKQGRQKPKLYSVCGITTGKKRPSQAP